MKLKKLLNESTEPELILTFKVKGMNVNEEKFTIRVYNSDGNVTYKVHPGWGSTGRGARDIIAFAGQALPKTFKAIGSLKIAIMSRLQRGRFIAKKVIKEDKTKLKDSLLKEGWKPYLGDTQYISTAKTVVSIYDNAILIKIAGEREVNIPPQELREIVKLLKSKKVI